MKDKRQNYKIMKIHFSFCTTVNNGNGCYLTSRRYHQFSRDIFLAFFDLGCCLYSELGVVYRLYILSGRYHAFFHDIPTPNSNRQQQKLVCCCQFCVLFLFQQRLQLLLLLPWEHPSLNQLIGPTQPLGNSLHFFPIDISDIFCGLPCPSAAMWNYQLVAESERFFQTNNDARRSGKILGRKDYIAILLLFEKNVNLASLVQSFYQKISRIRSVDLFCTVLKRKFPTHIVLTYYRRTLMS